MKHTKAFYSNYRETKTNRISYLIYARIITDFMKFLIRELLDTGEIHLPDKLGFLQIFGTKPKVKVENDKIIGLAPDWKSTKEFWEENPEAKEKKQLIYHFNEDTNGIRYKVVWKRDKVLIGNKFLYDFKLARANKRQLSKLIKNKKEYIIKKHGKRL